MYTLPRRCAVRPATKIAIGEPTYHLAYAAHIVESSAAIHPSNTSCRSSGFENAEYGRVALWMNEQIWGSEGMCIVVDTILAMGQKPGYRWSLECNSDRLEEVSPWWNQPIFSAHFS